MGFDFSALDAELDALGKQPVDVLQLAEQYAGAVRTTAEADRLLAALGEPVDASRYVVRAPALVAIPDAPAQAPSFVEPDVDFDDFAAESAGFFTPQGLDIKSPESGELALPEPVRRPQEPESGELKLDADAPTSGSFELPESDPDDATAVDEAELEPVFDAPSARAASSIPAPSFARNVSEPPEMQVDDLSVDDDDPDTRAVFAALGGLPDTASGEARLKGLSDLPAATITHVESRDPDAEFDAIFSDATSPSGIPTRGYGEYEENPSAEDLLSGLESALDSPEADALAGPAPQAGELEPDDGHTEVLDSRTLNSITSTAKHDERPPYRPDQTLDSSEFEIVVDDQVEPIEPVIKRSPPPPLPPPSGSTPLDKRPSFLGRLFGRKDQPNEP